MRKGDCRRKGVHTYGVHERESQGGEGQKG